MDSFGFIAGIATNLAYDLLKTSSEQAWLKAFGEAQQGEIRAVYETAFIALLSEAGHDLEHDQLTLVGDIFRDFVQDPSVSAILLKVGLSNEPLDLELLTELFDKLGFDRLTLSIDFEQALNTFHKSLTDAIFEKAKQPGNPLHNQVSLERLRAIQDNTKDIKEQLNRQDRPHPFIYRNKQEFPDPTFLYRPIQATVQALEAAITNLPGGYIGVFGAPGSGKSTLLTQTLRSLPLRLVRYYVYVPEDQDPSILRGETINFLQIVTSHLQGIGIPIGQEHPSDPSNRMALLTIFNAQLQRCGEDYAQTGTKTVILIDGLDHIQREQNPERSLLNDLPRPENLPKGVFIVLGSQTDELNALPNQIHYTLQQSARHIEMERLSYQAVYDIATDTTLEIDQEDTQRIFELSDGHPLALTYLLKQLQQADNRQELNRILNQAIRYSGDIEQQYWAHWRMIEKDEEIKHTLGLLARVRGAIPMRWVAQWSDTAKLKRLLLIYFREEGDQQKGYEQWVFFHNSFRLFLIAQTAPSLPGQTPEYQNRAYHRELAKLYTTAEPRWHWEKLYHLHQAAEFADLVNLATPEWFYAQVEALRPLDAIQTDIRLAIQAAGKEHSTVALAQLTLIGAAIEQRSWVLEDRLLPDLLIESGQATLAVEHLRNGNRLRVHAIQALRLSERLRVVDLAEEGRRLFELAEPLELLSGRTIPDDHTRPQDLWELLETWVQSATVFRPVSDIIRVVRQVRIEPSKIAAYRNGNDTEQASVQLQGRLLYKGAIACCGRDDWDGWRVFFDSLDEQRQRWFRFRTLLRSIEYVQQTDNQILATELAREMFDTFDIDILNALDDYNWRIEVQISLAELALWVMKDESMARVWVDQVLPISLRDWGSDYSNVPELSILRFRAARLLYALGDKHTPEEMVSEAEASTNFGAHAEDEEKRGYSTIARPLYHLARLSDQSKQGVQLSPGAFIQEVDWIFKLFVPEFARNPYSLFSAIRRDREIVFRIVIATAEKYGDKVVEALGSYLKQYWTNQDKASEWPYDLQRDLVVALIEAGIDHRWAKVQLKRIEADMLRGLDPYQRVMSCEAQAQAWLMIDEDKEALSEMHRMVQAARGIQSEKDYQLSQWVYWLEWINELQPECAEEQICLMLRRIISVRNETSGTGDAAIALLNVVFRWSPRRAVRLLKGFLEHHIVEHQRGVSCILQAALKGEEPPPTEVLCTLLDLLIPFGRGAEPRVIEKLIPHLYHQFGTETTLDMVDYIIHRIRSDALANNRWSWLSGVADGLHSIGCTLDQVELDSSEIADPTFRDDSQLDRNFHLQSGVVLKPEEVLQQIQTLANLHQLLEGEDRDRNQYFDWVAVVKHIVPKLVTIQDLQTCSQLITERITTRAYASQSLTAFSHRALELGHQEIAWAFAEQALDATEASGWNQYFDGGARHGALKQLLTIDAGKIRVRAIQLYADDLSERLRSPGWIIPYFYDVFSLFSETLPIAEIWPVIEVYLDDLFTSVQVEPQPALETLVTETVDMQIDDTPAQAIADLLQLYLDHPSHTIAQGAVRACTNALLNESSTVKLALEKALTGSDSMIERALMVLEAVGCYNPDLVMHFSDHLERLLTSLNFVLRFFAHRILTNMTNKSSVLPMVQRNLPPIYTIYLPEMAVYNTVQKIQGHSPPAVLNDLARQIQPFDEEVRHVAKIAQLSEDNVFYQTVQYLHKLQSMRTWLAGSNVLDEKRLQTFLDKAGLDYTFNKPHITPVRTALAYVIAELYDSESISSDYVFQLAAMLKRHDPDFVLQRPEPRPSAINPIGGTENDSSFPRFPDTWIGNAEHSLDLLNLHSSDGRIIIGEWTRLRYLDRDRPEEERMSFIRLTSLTRLWEGYDIENGHPPFSRKWLPRAADYLHVEADLDDLLVAYVGNGIETPGLRWIALNPIVGWAMGWRPRSGKWFSWEDQQGNVVVESIWWSDGGIECYDWRQRVEIGSGWLILMTEEGFKAMQQRIENMSRGGVVWRQKGWYGDAGRRLAYTELPL